ncbi:MAG: L,D-transpeptidase [Ignavibacteria bacterium]|nr:L,D-transpeptidase [Ignavibacteria bacterium]
MLRNVLYISGSILIFFTGLIIYGVILNLREQTLEEILKEKGIDKLKDVHLVVNRMNYRVELYSNKTFIKNYKAVFGKNSGTIKTSTHDLITPLGEFKICYIDTNSRYHRFLQINYPNEKVAAEALKQGYLNENEFKTIQSSSKNNDCPPKETRLGSNIGIHGIGKYNFIFKNLPFTFNWTNGSVAVSNENIDEILSVVKIGTEVKITF